MALCGFLQSDQEDPDSSTRADMSDQEIEKYAPAGVNKMLVGTKKDLVSKRVVSRSARSVPTSLRGRLRVVDCPEGHAARTLFRGTRVSFLF